MTPIGCFLSLYLVATAPLVDARRLDLYQTSPSYGMATLVQLTDQGKWEAMLTELINKMPGEWKVLNKEVPDHFELNLLEASEGVNFGNQPGVFCGNWHWQSVDKPEDETRQTLQEARDHKEQRRVGLLERDGKLDEFWGYNFDDKIEDLERQMKIWSTLDGSPKDELNIQLKQHKYFQVRPPYALELLHGEHPRLPRYARHFRSLASKNVGFAPIIRIMQKFFGEVIYSTGHQCERGHKDGVRLATDGSAATFYASLRARLYPPQRASGPDTGVSASSSAAATASAIAAALPVPGITVAALARQSSATNVAELREAVDTEEKAKEAAVQAATTEERVQAMIGRERRPTKEDAAAEDETSESAAEAIKNAFEPRGWTLPKAADAAGAPDQTKEDEAAKEKTSESAAEAIENAFEAMLKVTSPDAFEDNVKEFDKALVAFTKRLDPMQLDLFQGAMSTRFKAEAKTKVEREIAEKAAAAKAEDSNSGGEMAY